jgi:hypothetical protein
MRVRIVMLVVTVAALLACTAASSAFVRHGYRAFPTCNVFDHPPRSDGTCVFGDAFGAVLVAHRRAHIHYKLCVETPSGKHRCYRKRLHGKGKPSRVGLFGRLADREPTGTWDLKWKHGGHLIDRDRLHVGSEGV